MKPMKHATTLGEFILTEMRRRDMSARKFAEFIGVDSKTINKFLNHGFKDVGDPSMEFVGKLAVATHTDPCTLLGFIMPDIVSNYNGVRPDAMLLSQRIEELPENVKETIDGIISKWASQ